jgi:DNA helicase HerA-like ATPase
MTAWQLGQHWAVFGVTGAGKTYWTLHTVLERSRRVLVVDTKYGDDFKPDQWPPVTLDWLQQSKVLRDTSKAFHLAFRPRFDSKEADVEALSRLLMREGRAMIVDFDEITDYSSASKVGPCLKELFRKSRSHQLTIIASTQRPAGFNHWFQDNCVHKVYFALGDYDEEFARIPKRVLDKLPEVPYGSYRYIYQSPSKEITVGGGP